MFPLQISFMSLIDVRVMNNGNSDPPKASSGWTKKAPIVNEARSAGPSNNYKQTHAPIEGTHASIEGKHHCWLHYCRFGFHWVESLSANRNQLMETETERK